MALRARPKPPPDTAGAHQNPPFVQIWLLGFYPDHLRTRGLNHMHRGPWGHANCTTACPAPKTAGPLAPHTLPLGVWCTLDHLTAVAHGSTVRSLTSLNRTCRCQACMSVLHTDHSILSYFEPSRSTWGKHYTGRICDLEPCEQNPTGRILICRVTLRRLTG